MAIIKCSECGRAVSDKAAACVGCGAPLNRPEPPSAFNREPVYTMTAPLTPSQLRWRLGLATLTLVLGVILAHAAEQYMGIGRAAKTLSALLVIVGVCWFIIAVVQNVQAHRK